MINNGSECICDIISCLMIMFNDNDHVWELHIIMKYEIYRISVYELHGDLSKIMKRIKYHYSNNLTVEQTIIVSHTMNT